MVMNKKMSMALSVLTAFALMVSGCGKKTGTTNSTVETKASESVTTEAPTETEATTREPAGPGGAAYAWIGLQDLPKCQYGDALASAHYIMKYSYMGGGYHTDTTEAVDGVNSFTGTEGTMAYSIDGHYLGINIPAKLYWEREDKTSDADAKNRQKAAMASGDNSVGRVFKSKGQGAIPKYSDWCNDPAEYEYYEYDYPEMAKNGMTKIERFYMKDGEVLAIYYEEIVFDEVINSYTLHIQSVSQDIPAGTFDLPSLDGYTKQKD